MLRDKNGLTEAEFLARYDAGKYPRPSVTADVAAFLHEDGKPRVLLVRRGGHPFIGTWALPGGFVEPEETVETAARRELWEETGIENVPVRQIGTYSDPHRDPRTRVITVAFYSCLDGLSAQPKAGDDAAEAGFFEIVCTPRAESGEDLLDFTLDGCGETLHFPCASSPRPAASRGISPTNRSVSGCLPATTSPCWRALLRRTGKRADAGFAVRKRF